MSQKRRTDKSSTTAAVQGFAGVMSDVPLPAGDDLMIQGATVPILSHENVGEEVSS